MNSGSLISAIALKQEEEKPKFQGFKPTGTSVKLHTSKSYKRDNNILIQFRPEIFKQLENTIGNLYGINSPKYKEFFPSGYSQTKRYKFDITIEHIINTLDSHSADFEADYAADLKAWYCMYKGAGKNRKEKQSKQGFGDTVKPEISR